MTLSLDDILQEVANAAGVSATDSRTGKTALPICPLCTMPVPDEEPEAYDERGDAIHVACGTAAGRVRGEGSK